MPITNSKFIKPEEIKNCFLPNKLHLASVPRTPFPSINYSNPYLINKEKNNENNIIVVKVPINPHSSPIVLKI